MTPKPELALPEENAQVIDEHSRRYYLFDGRVVVYEVKGFTRPAIDAWYNIAVSTHKIWDASKPYIAIHDVRQARLTPYARQRASDMTTTLGEKKGDTIMLLANDLYGQVIALFGRSLSYRPQPYMRRHFATSWEQAIETVQRILAQQYPR